MRILFFLILFANIGCLRSTEFKCMESTQCTGTGGTCETNGYCSFTDGMCSSGRRYGEFSGSLSGKCVGEENPMIDSGMGDGPMGDVPPGSCTGYTMLAGAGTHRYKATANAAQWSTQRDRCAADGANAYLAIPDDMAELQAITTAAAAARTWVGISDTMTEGTYVTVKGGAAATYLPWDTANNEPDNGGPGGQDCVSALMASPNIATDGCSNTFPAMCECEP